ncbi:MAG: 7-cyano-7-deazaguanine synthase, partial [Bdellovibrionales bacterium]|nr:7-cyano-7-deazaguanine synthase [Bdellovibrionales bacterium]
SLSSPGNPTSRAYWSVPQKIASTFVKYEEAVDELYELLKAAVQLQSIADVPVGAFLSGGVDSSLVVALLASEAGAKVESFTIGFHEAEFNEAPYARAIAGHLGTTHHELYVTPADALAQVPLIAEVFDEPFADSSQIPTLLVSQLARQQVVVSLSGDGGDELFTGYQRYTLAMDVWRWMRQLPQSVRSVVGGILRNVPESMWIAIYRIFNPILPVRARDLPDIGGKLHRLGEVMGSPSIGKLYNLMNQQWREGIFPTHFRAPDTVLSQDGLEQCFDSPLDYFTYLDLQTYLPDDILVKVDRSSMAYGLEARGPLLDHRIVEYSRGIPAEYSVSRGVQKRILRDCLFRHVPPSHFERPKSGFGIPLAEWLRGPLRLWGEELLSAKNLPQNGILDRETIIRYWDSHQNRTKCSHYLLWNVLVFQSWMCRWRRHITF